MQIKYCRAKKSFQPSDIKLGLCNKCPVYFQLNIITWHLIGFHGNRSIKTTFQGVKIIFFNDIHPVDRKSI